MKPQKRNNGTNTCLTDSVAYIANLPAKQVPFFISSKRWVKRLGRWALRYGYRTRLIFYNTKTARALERKKKLYIAVGLSPRSKAKKADNRTLNHAVVKRGDKYIYDNAERKSFLKGKPLYYIEFTKIRISGKI